MSVVSVAFLVAVNMVPLFGVVFFGWNLFSVMLLYWAESGIVGLFNVAKISLASVPASGDHHFTSFTINGRDASSFEKFGKFFVIPFFIFHYGLFWIVHGVFVVVLFGVLGGELFFIGADSAAPAPPDFMRGFAGFEPLGVGVAFVSIFLSHGLSFFVNFVGKEEYRNVSPTEQMFRPYSRVVVLHVTILLGGVLVGCLGAPLVALAVLVLLKTGVDIFAHLRERGKAASTPEIDSETNSETASV